MDDGQIVAASDGALHLLLNCTPNIKVIYNLNQTIVNFTDVSVIICYINLYSW